MPDRKQVQKGNTYITINARVCNCSTTVEDLAQSTFSGLTTDKKPPAKVSEIPKAETALQSRTTPPRDFGKEVGCFFYHILHFA